MKEINQSAELIQCTPDAMKMLERIARVCYNSENKMKCDCADGNCPKCHERQTAFLGSLKRNRHESIFEHASATFLLITDRGITHEIVRHRLASYTQSSTRYIKYDDDMPVVRPIFVNDKEEAVWRHAMEEAERAYRKLLEDGAPAQNARDVLPTCTAAKLFVTANFRQWRHILQLRMEKGAHPKVRALCAMILEQLIPHCPVYFDDLKKETTAT